VKKERERTVMYIGDVWRAMELRRNERNGTAKKNTGNEDEIGSLVDNMRRIKQRRANFLAMSREEHRPPR
jgi:hypothetical protein